MTSVPAYHHLAADPALGLVVALVLGTVFAAAAVTKLRALGAFAGLVDNYRLLPASLVMPVAIALPVLELLAAAGLVVPAARPAAAGMLVALLLLFAAAMAINLLRGRSDIDCGCFVSLLKQRISWALVIRNLLLAGAGTILVVGTAPAQARPLTALDLATVAAGAGSLLLLYAAIGRLYGLAAPQHPHGAS